jgi:hypothetical protein
MELFLLFLAAVFGNIAGHLIYEYCKGRLNR